jgi:hypothetical protein
MISSAALGSESVWAHVFDETKAHPRRSELTRLTLDWYLEAEGQACQGYRAALRSGNRRWITEARARWLAMHDLVSPYLRP